MIFTKENKGKTVINLSLINHIDDDNDSFYVSLVNSVVILQKDANSQKLFDWFADKTEKDMSTKQDLDSAMKESMKKAQELIAQLNIKRGS